MGAVAVGAVAVDAVAVDAVAVGAVAVGAVAVDAVAVGGNQFCNPQTPASIYTNDRERVSQPTQTTRRGTVNID